MDRMPGRPPTPMLSACTPNPTEIMAAQQDPIMPQTSGKHIFQVYTEECRFRDAQVTGDAMPEH